MLASVSKCIHGRVVPMHRSTRHGRTDKQLLRHDLCRIAATKSHYVSTYCVHCSGTIGAVYIREFCKQIKEFGHVIIDIGIFFSELSAEHVPEQTVNSVFNCELILTRTRTNATHSGIASSAQVSSDFPHALMYSPIVVFFVMPAVLSKDSAYGMWAV